MPLLNRFGLQLRNRQPQGFGARVALYLVKNFYTGLSKASPALRSSLTGEPIKPSVAQGSQTRQHAQCQAPHP